MQLTPSVKLSAVSSGLPEPELSLRIRPNLWEDACVPLPNSSEPSQRDSKPVPPVRLRSLDSLHFEPTTFKAKAENEVRRNKQREREKAMLAPTSSKMKTFPHSAVFDARECAKCHKSLKNVRKERWSHPQVEPERERKVPIPLLRMSRGMHHPPRKSPGSTVSAGATVLRDRMTQEILQRYTTSVDWDKTSHMSAGSLKEMILMQGHATEVPDPLRHLEPQRKVKAWLSSD